MVGRLPSSFGGLRALILNEREVRELTERSDVPTAAGHLAALGTTVVVTLGAGGAMAIEPDGRSVQVDAPLADVGDTTGAGDLFAAAYVWADLAGRPLAERLHLATRYASLSLERATDRQKGITLGDFTDLLPTAGPPFR
jgi:sugar/nucleoside kinase (ribokinase family)